MPAAGSYWGGFLGAPMEKHLVCQNRLDECLAIMCHYLNQLSSNRIDGVISEAGATRKLSYLSDNSSARGDFIIYLNGVLGVLSIR